MLHPRGAGQPYGDASLFVGEPPTVEMCMRRLGAGRPAMEMRCTFMGMAGPSRLRLKKFRRGSPLPLDFCVGGRPREMLHF